jgi:hypothetical protein
MEKNHPFELKLKEDTATLVTQWAKSFEFKLTWQGKEYRAIYWWDSEGEEGIDWENKPEFGENEDEIIEQIFEYIEKNIDKEFLNFSVIV